MLVRFAWPKNRVVSECFSVVHSVGVILRLEAEGPVSAIHGVIFAGLLPLGIFLRYASSTVELNSGRAGFDSHFKTVALHAGGKS